MVMIGLVSLPMSLGQTAFADKSSLQAGLAEWCVDPAAAAATYGAIGAWDVSGVTDMSSVLNNAPCGWGSTFNEDINAWNMGQVTTTKYMFGNAAAFNQPVGAWNMAKVTRTSVRRSPSNHIRTTDAEGVCGEATVLRRRVHGCRQCFPLRPSSTRTSSRGISARRLAWTACSTTSGSLLWRTA